MPMVAPPYSGLTNPVLPTSPSNFPASTWPSTPSYIGFSKLGVSPFLRRSAIFADPTVPPRHFTYRPTTIRQMTATISSQPHEKVDPVTSRGEVFDDSEPGVGDAVGDMVGAEVIVLVDPTTRVIVP